MTDLDLQLLDLLRKRSFRRGTFKLASGATSDYYIDGRMSAVHSEGAYLIGQSIYDHTRDLKMDAIGGLEVGAVPLATSAVIAYHLHGQAMEGFWVRDRAKDHGTKKLVEGGVGKGARVVVLEDVVTTGSSAVKAIETVRDELQAEVLAVVSLVDRLQGAHERFTALGIADYRPLFTIRDLGVS